MLRLIREMWGFSPVNKRSQTNYHEERYVMLAGWF
jgi:hypothetical protein